MPEDPASPLQPEGPPAPKEDLLAQIWSLSSTLTEEAMAAATRKAQELQLDQNRGVVSLRESFINLSSARGVLEDAIDKQKLVQLPITVQKELLTNLQAISKPLQGLTAGTDEIVNLVNSIEALNTAIWKYGLYNLSDQVLGYQTKLNQIKAQEVQISKVIAELESATDAARKASTAAKEIEQNKIEATSSFEQVQKLNSESGDLLKQIRDAADKSSALIATIQQQEKQSGELASSIRTSSNELAALDASIKKFYSEVEDYRGRINQTGEDAASLIRTSEASVKKFLDESTAEMNSAIEALRKTEASVTEKLLNDIDTSVAETATLVAKLDSDLRGGIRDFQGTVEATLATSLDNIGTLSNKLVADSKTKLDGLATQMNVRSKETIEANQTSTAELVAELATLKDQIKAQIQQATGFQLFGAFQARQNMIARSKNQWVVAILGLVAVSAGVTVWIAREAQYYRADSLAFWVKLSLTLPLGYAIGFCTVQYNKERRLEEEYAFKASISVSLNPYRDLIHSILKEDGTDDQTKYSDFVVDSVRNVFTPPTDKVFDSEHRSGVTEKALKSAAELLGTAVKAAK
jgi:predicted  nucleic acid-binding Zn-ribbon protein